MPYSDAEDSDYDVEVGDGAKLLAAETEVELPLLSQSKTTSTGSGTLSSGTSSGSSESKAVTSPDSSCQLEKAVKVSEEEKSESSGYRVTPDEPNEVAKQLDFPAIRESLGGRCSGHSSSIARDTSVSS